MLLCVEAYDTYFETRLSFINDREEYLHVNISGTIKLVASRHFGDRLVAWLQIEVNHQPYSQLGGQPMKQTLVGQIALPNPVIRYVHNLECECVIHL